MTTLTPLPCSVVYAASLADVRDPYRFTTFSFVHVVAVAASAIIRASQMSEPRALAPRTYTCRIVEDVHDPLNVTVLLPWMVTLVAFGMLDRLPVTVLLPWMLT